MCKNNQHLKKNCYSMINRRRLTRFTETLFYFTLKLFDLNSETTACHGCFATKLYVHNHIEFSVECDQRKSSVV